MALLLALLLGGPIPIVPGAAQLDALLAQSPARVTLHSLRNKHYSPRDPHTTRPPPLLGTHPVLGWSRASKESPARAGDGASTQGRWASSVNDLWATAAEPPCLVRERRVHLFGLPQVVPPTTRVLPRANGLVLSNLTARPHAACHLTATSLAEGGGDSPPQGPSPPGGIRAWGRLRRLSNAVAPYGSQGGWGERRLQRSAVAWCLGRHGGQWDGSSEGEAPVLWLAARAPLVVVVAAGMGMRVCGGHLPVCMGSPALPFDCGPLLKSCTHSPVTALSGLVWWHVPQGTGSGRGSSAA